MNKENPISVLALNADELELSLLLNLDALGESINRLGSVDDIEHLQSGDQLIVVSRFLDSGLFRNLSIINERHDLVVILLTSEYEKSSHSRALKCGVEILVYVQDGATNPTNLSIALISSKQTWARYKMLRNELEEFKVRLANRAYVERAKGIVMRKRGISEDEAYTRMRRTAMNEGKSMAVLAQQILSVPDSAVCDEL